jgi:hypothetical protein
MRTRPVNAVARETTAVLSAMKAASIQQQYTLLNIQKAINNKRNEKRSQI